jgi:hypothetical protein
MQAATAGQVYSFSDAGESETVRGKKGAGLLSRAYIQYHVSFITDICVTSSSLDVCKKSKVQNLKKMS